VTTPSRPSLDAAVASLLDAAVASTNGSEEES